MATVADEHDAPLHGVTEHAEQHVASAHDLDEFNTPRYDFDEDPTERNPNDVLAQQSVAASAAHESDTEDDDDDEEQPGVVAVQNRFEFEPAPGADGDEPVTIAMVEPAVEEAVTTATPSYLQAPLAAAEPVSPPPTVPHSWEPAPAPSTEATREDSEERPV